MLQARVAVLLPDKPDQIVLLVHLEVVLNLVEMAVLRHTVLLQLVAQIFMELVLNLAQLLQPLQSHLL
jgi:hypothetical protein